MRHWPNGWPSKNHVATLKKTLVSSGNSYAPVAVTSDSLDSWNQKSHAPQKWAGKLNFGLGAGTWQISAAGSTAERYGTLGKNPAGGRINNIRFQRPKILIRSFMPKDALPFHRALKNLRRCHQAMLWTHYVLKVAHSRKVDLLQTTPDLYPKWLDISRRAIARKIEELKIEDLIAELNSKTSIRKLKADRNDHCTGPLWSCRIFPSICKFPIRRSKVKDLLPVSFSPQGIRNPRSPADYLPTCDYNVFRRPNGEVYAVVSNIEYGRLFRQGRAASFLAERPKNVADFTYCHLDDWHPIKCYPVNIRSKESTFRSVAAVDGIVMIGTRFIVWEKPVPHYNSPEWLKKRGLTKLDECARRWSRELLNDERHPWTRGGENGWYL